MTGRSSKLATSELMSDFWLKTSDLCRYYRRGQYEVRAVDRVNLTLPKGEFLAVVGASGSGKSTLLNLLAGLDTPTSGRIDIAGLSLNEMTRRERSAYRARRVGMIFQSFNLLTHQTALRNVELALYFDGTPKRERRRQAAEMLEKLGMADRLDHRPGDLSGGEQQRVAIARALVKNPEILFADEPTGNLDHDNAQQMADLLIDLNRRGLTVIIVTHDLDLARTCSHRLVRMHYGVLTNGEPHGESGETS